MAAYVPVVVDQHADEAGVLWHLRNEGTGRANFALMYLLRFDLRLDAHLDALAVAGPAGKVFTDRRLDDPSPGAVFVSAFGAAHRGDDAGLHQMIALSAALPSVRRGLFSALGWSAKNIIGPIVTKISRPDQAVGLTAAIAACSMHGVDPSSVIRIPLAQLPPLARARVLRTQGELGLGAAAHHLDRFSGDEDADVQFWAAWSAALLHVRGWPVDRLRSEVAGGGPHAARAARLVLQMMSMSEGRDLARDVVARSQTNRPLVTFIGIIGDSAAVPWLFEQMRDDNTARLAGEAFSLITGIDLALLDLERKPPENFESGPNDNPDDDNVDMDPDEGLPWPDVQKIEAWWMQNRDRFTPGRRYFMGQPVTKEHCIHVLKHGYQRQRILAAQYLCLLEPGTPLFNTSAPAWRQQRLLARM